MSDFMNPEELPIELREQYLERRRKDVADGLNALSAADFFVLSKIGHQVRGNAASFGFDLLTPVASELEQAAQQKDLEKSRELLNSFEVILNEYRPV